MKEKGTLENPFTYGDEAEICLYNTFTSKDEPVHIKMVRKLELPEMEKMINELKTHFDEGSILKIEVSNDEYTRYGVVVQIDYKGFPTSESGQSVHGIPIFSIYYEPNDYTFPLKYVTSEGINLSEGSIHDGDVFEYAILIRYPKGRDESNIIIKTPRISGTHENFRYFKI